MARALRPQPTILVIRNIPFVRSTFADLTRYESGTSSPVHAPGYEFTSELVRLWINFLDLPNLGEICEQLARWANPNQPPINEVTAPVLAAIVEFGAVSQPTGPYDRAAIRTAWHFLLETLRDLIDGLLLDPTQGYSEPLTLEFQSSLNNIAREAENHESAGQAHWALMESREQAERAQEAREFAELAAGVSSSARLTGSYDQYATANEKESKFFRRSTLALVAAAIIIPFILHVMLLTTFQLESTNLATLIYPLVVSGGLFGVAGYCSRQAHLHRTLATWSKTISIQLQTFDGFVAPVDNVALRDTLRSQFAERVFGAHPKLKGEPGVSASSPMIDTVLTKFTRDPSA
ncbi:hypothetical protein ABIB48_002225 [Arthrobacter sp. UYCu511]